MHTAEDWWVISPTSEGPRRLSDHDQLPSTIHNGTILIQVLVERQEPEAPVETVSRGGWSWLKTKFRKLLSTSKTRSLPQDCGAKNEECSEFHQPLERVLKSSPLRASAASSSYTPRHSSSGLNNPQKILVNIGSVTPNAISNTSLQSQQHNDHDQPIYPPVDSVLSFSPSYGWRSSCPSSPRVSLAEDGAAMREKGGRNSSGFSIASQLRSANIMLRCPVGPRLAASRSMHLLAMRNSDSGSSPSERYLHRGSSSFADTKAPQFSQGADSHHCNSGWELEHVRSRGSSGSGGFNRSGQPGAVTGPNHLGPSSSRSSRSDILPTILQHQRLREDSSSSSTRSMSRTGSSRGFCQLQGAGDTKSVGNTDNWASSSPSSSAVATRHADLVCSLKLSSSGTRRLDSTTRISEESQGSSSSGGTWSARSSHEGSGAPLARGQQRQDSLGWAKGPRVSWSVVDEEEAGSVSLGIQPGQMQRSVLPPIDCLGPLTNPRGPKNEDETAGEALGNDGCEGGRATAVLLKQQDRSVCLRQVVSYARQGSRSSRLRSVSGNNVDFQGTSSKELVSIRLSDK